MAETQYTITDWCDKTFGPISNHVRIAVRANEEMSELLCDLAVDNNHPKAAEEIADVFIVLYRLATCLGVDIQEEINRKMSVNRTRQWKLDGTGHGYHIKPSE